MNNSVHVPASPSNLKEVIELRKTVSPKRFFAACDRISKEKKVFQKVGPDSSVDKYDLGDCYVWVVEKELQEFVFVEIGDNYLDNMLKSDLTLDTLKNLSSTSAALDIELPKQILLTSASQIQVGTIIQDANGTKKVVIRILEKLYGYALIGWDGKPSRWSAGYDLLSEVGVKQQFILN